MITVWLFTSVDGKTTSQSVMPMRDDDYQYQHEYQRILYRGNKSGWVEK